MATPAPGCESAELALERSTTPQSPAAETDYHLRCSKLYLVLAGIGLAIFLFALDISVVATV